MSATMIDHVEDELLKFIPEVEDKDERATFAGSSVHFDLGFIRVHMPRLAKRLSHRVYCVSAVQLFCRSLGMAKPPKGPEPHRAAADVLASIERAKLCSDWLGGPVPPEDAQPQGGRYA